MLTHEQRTLKQQQRFAFSPICGRLHKRPQSSVPLEKNPRQEVAEEVAEVAEGEEEIPSRMQKAHLQTWAT